MAQNGTNKTQAFNAAQYGQRMANPSHQMMAQGMPSQLAQPGRTQRPTMQQQPLFPMTTPGAANGQNGVKSVGATPTPGMMQKTPQSQFKVAGNMQGVAQPQQIQMQQHQLQMLQRQQAQQQLNQSQPQQLQKLNTSGTQTPQADATTASQSAGPMSSTLQASSALTGPQGKSPQKAENGVSFNAMQNEINAKIYKRNLGNAGVMRVLDLIDLVSNEPTSSLSSLEFWLRLTQTYLLPTSIMRLTIESPPQNLDNQGYLDGLFNSGGVRLHELDVNTAPRFFMANNLAKHQVSLPGLKFQVLNNGSVFIASKLHISFAYKDDTTGTVNGSCRILLSRDFRIDWVDCKCSTFESSITMSSLEKKCQAYKQNDKQNHDSNGQPTQDFYELVLATSESVKAAKNSGFQDQAMRVMQIGDLMSCLYPLMSFSMANGIKSPFKALEAYMSANSQNGTSQLHMVRSVGAQNIPASSPSPRTVTGDESKNILKKRKLSTSMNSPMNQEHRR